MRIDSEVAALMCRYFTELWELTNRPRSELIQMHAPTHDVRQQPRPPEFVRLAEFFKAEPRSHRPCRCGCDDAWRCWSQTASGELLGGNRVWR
jgi:hypothetical protein